MKRLIGAAALFAILVGAFQSPRGRLVLYAQTVPATVHAHWTPNAASDNIINYVVTLDGVNPVTVAASTCTATDCVATVSVPAFGAHVSSIVAQNLLISTDPASLQASLPATVNWTLSQRASAPGGLTIRP